VTSYNKARRGGKTIDNIDWNSLEWRKLVLTRQEWLGREKVNFDLTGRLELEEVSFGLT
jgi:hypothetical protein